MNQSPILRLVTASELHGDQVESQEATIATSWREGERTGKKRDQGSWEEQETEKDEMTVSLLYMCSILSAS